MNQLQIDGRQELLKIRKRNRPLFWGVALFSMFVNLLMLAGPLYMLQVYDRVLGSRSYETLMALTILVGFLYLMMGILDFTRSRIMARIGARFQSSLDRRVFDAVTRRASTKPDEISATGLSDLEAVQGFIASPALTALFDIPMVPVFMFGIFIFHPWLGYLASGGGLILILLALLNQAFTKHAILEAGRQKQGADRMADQIRNEAEMVYSMGMRSATFERWQTLRDAALGKSIKATDLRSSFTAITKTFRLMLQSAMLGLGAYLALGGSITPGAMIAGSILMGRALAPMEQLIGQWAIVQRAIKGWSNLEILLGETPVEPKRTTLPRPNSRLQVQQLTVVPPNETQAALRMVSFSLAPGQAIGVIGASGAGKSTLARALTGIWKPAGGRIRLDGATLDQYDPDRVGDYIGYLPQRVQLFEGTLAENIARMATTPDDTKVVEAAKKADAHKLIVDLPDGYNTRVSATNGRLSGGQIQRIGLARALYGEPVLLVLDEPNSNLDNEGSTALNRAIHTLKKEGKSVLIMAHRPAAIQECELLLILDQGAVMAFGPRDEVLKKHVQNHKEIAAAKPTSPQQPTVPKV